MSSRMVPSNRWSLVTPPVAPPTRAARAGADAFTGGVADVRDVWLDARVEGADLVAEGGFDLPEFVLDHQEWKADFIVAGDLGLGIHADWGGLVKLFTRCGDSQPILPVNSGFLGLFWDCCRK